MASLLERHPLLLFLMLLMQCGCGYGAIDVGKCGSTLGCFREPVDCATEAACDYVAAWNLKAGDNTVLELEMSGKSTGWVGVAFSEDGVMGPTDTLIACIDDSSAAGGVKVDYYVLTGKTSPKALDTAAPAGSLDVVQKSSSGGRISCQMTRPLDVANAEVLNLSGKTYYLLLGVGPSPGGGAIGKHANQPTVTAAPVSLTETGSAGAAGAPPLLKTHGICMLLAWVTFAGIGLMTARYFKTTLDADDCMSLKVWFTVHRTCMITVFCLTIAGFVTIFVQVKDFSDFQSWSPRVLQAHPILGVIVTALAIINPLGALCRPHPGTPNRVYFNWIHWSIGTLAHILGVITIFMGVNLRPSLNPTWLTWVMVAYVAVHAVCEILLEVQKCNSKQAAPGEEMQMKGGDNSGNYGQISTRGENHSFKKAILFIYCFIVIGLGVFMAVMIGLD